MQVGDAYIVLAGYDRTDPEHATTALRTAQAMIHVARSVQVPEEELVTSCAEPSGRNGVLKSMSKVDLTEHDDMPSEGDRKSGGSGGQLPTKVSPHSAEHRQEPSKRCLQIRVGIHTGPLSASTLGFRRNALTLVGDTLNGESAWDKAWFCGMPVPSRRPYLTC